MPARARRDRDPPPLPEIAKTRPAATPAPTSEAPSVPVRVATPLAAVTVTTRNAAPALMPRTPGSARGFRVIACMMEPASPSAPPMTSAATVRGTRSCVTTWASWLTPPFTSASHTTSGAIWREPRASEARVTAASTSVATAQAMATLAMRRVVMSGHRPGVFVHRPQEAGTNWASMLEMMPSMRR